MLRKITLVAVCLVALVGASVRVSAKPEVTVDEIVAKIVKAQGGAEKVKAIKSVKSTGKFTYGPYEGTVSILQKRPKKLRRDINIGPISLTTVINGDSGWQNAPPQAGGSGKPEKLSADDYSESEDDADMDGEFIDYKAKGTTIELVGKEEFEGSPVYILKVTDKKGKTATYTVDADSGFILKVKSKRKARGTEVETESILSNYKEVNGVFFAFNIEIKGQGGGPGQSVTLEKIEVDTNIDDAQFDFPAEKPADKPAETKPSGK
jgi:outer membrane lipoprotein-sorting protein